MCGSSACRTLVPIRFQGSQLRQADHDSWPRKTSMCVFQVNSLLVLTSCTKYILGLLQFHCDFLLDELQIHLREFWNLNVSISTIWHAMKNAGLTWKKVCCLCMILRLQ